MYCKYCGNEYSPGQKYCSFCGNALPQKVKFKDRTWSSLLLIPLALLIAALLFYGASMADLAIANSAENAVGHGMPAVTLIAFLPVCGITLYLIILAIVRTVKKARRKKHR